MENGACIPLRVNTIVISVQHSKDASWDLIASDLMELVIQDDSVIPRRYLDSKTIYLINPSGKFVIGGPQVRMHNYFISLRGEHELANRKLVEHSRFAGILLSKTWIDGTEIGKHDQLEHN